MINPHAKENLIQAMESALREARKMPTTTECMFCVNYSENANCLLATEKIPEDILKSGCESWQFDPDSAPF